eukprot:TRINITY_DN19592_c0_g1_i3.p3 TRINITY_DN19592_c0_g1~~TRINITY_DN19592_c0_g1_i3.p3  ORF type:complete len:194 (+),score=-12.99 TRINITY_DN19592_c0_g1_i3:124-705(+)
MLTRFWMVLLKCIYTAILQNDKIVPDKPGFQVKHSFLTCKGSQLQQKGKELQNIFQNQNLLRFTHTYPLSLKAQSHKQNLDTKNSTLTFQWSYSYKSSNQTNFNFEDYKVDAGVCVCVGRRQQNFNQYYYQYYNITLDASGDQKQTHSIYLKKKLLRLLFTNYSIIFIIYSSILQYIIFYFYFFISYTLCQYT